MSGSENVSENVAPRSPRDEDLEMIHEKFLYDLGQPGGMDFDLLRPLFDYERSQYDRRHDGSTSSQNTTTGAAEFSVRIARAVAPVGRATITGLAVAKL